MNQIRITVLLLCPLSSAAAPSAAAVEPVEKATSLTPVNNKNTPPGQEDVAKTRERIIQDANEAGKRLGNKDPGRQTQMLQKDVLDNIDALIRKAQEPPPMDANPDQAPMPKNDASKEDAPMRKKETNKDSTSEVPLNRKERRQKNQITSKNGGMSNSRPKQQELLPDPKTSQTENASSKIEEKVFTPRLPASYKDVWGHLPDKMRQEMDLYFREQFMPRYSDLLRQYYSSLAERQGKTSMAP